MNVVDASEPRVQRGKATILQLKMFFFFKREPREISSS